METKICKQDACLNAVKAHGLCKTHYMRFWRGQDLNRVTRKTKRPAIIEGDIARIPLGIDAKDGYALVDAIDASVDSKQWSISRRGYVTYGNGKTLHHLLLGKPPIGLVVDHINRNRLDNRRSNMRFVTRLENVRNAGIGKNNTSGYKGVYKTANGNWKADIKVNYKKISLGTHKHIGDAARAYNGAAQKYFGDFAVLNKVASNE